MSPAWPIEHVIESADDIHHRAWPTPLLRTIWRCSVTRPAVVLGSSQITTPDQEALAAEYGFDICRRASGGAAVWLSPSSSIWVDVFVPHSDVAHRDDIGKAAVVIGRAWQAALWRIGHTTTVHQGPMVTTPLSKLWCFDGIGPGEVVDVSTGGKMVGISQRRTRVGSRFQCVAYLYDDSEFAQKVVGLPKNSQLRVIRPVRASSEHEIAALISYFVAELPSINSAK